VRENFRNRKDEWRPVRVDPSGGPPPTRVGLLGRDGAGGVVHGGVSCSMKSIPALYFYRSYNADTSGTETEFEALCDPFTAGTRSVAS
jgi:hypothetical protein